MLYMDAVQAALDITWKVMEALLQGRKVKIRE